MSPRPWLSLLCLPDKSFRRSSPPGWPYIKQKPLHKQQFLFVCAPYKDRNRTEEVIQDVLDQCQIEPEGSVLISLWNEFVLLLECTDRQQDAW